MSFIDITVFYVVGSFVAIAFMGGILGGMFASWIDGKIYLRKLNRLSNKGKKL